MFECILKIWIYLTQCVFWLNVYVCVFLKDVPWKSQSPRLFLWRKMAPQKVPTIRLQAPCWIMVSTRTPLFSTVVRIICPSCKSPTLSCSRRRITSKSSSHLSSKRTSSCAKSSLSRRNVLTSSRTSWTRLWIAPTWRELI